MNRRGFIGALAALVAAPAAVLRTKFVMPRGLRLVWDADYPTDRVFFINPRYFLRMEYQPGSWFIAHNPRALGVITHIDE
jgi:hypothetical protein